MFWNSSWFRVNVSFDDWTSVFVKCVLEPYGLNRRDELSIIVIHILISFSFFHVLRHFRLSLLNILHLYLVTSVNLKKAGMASLNIVMKKQYTLLWQ